MPHRIPKRTKGRIVHRLSPNQLAGVATLTVALLAALLLLLQHPANPADLEKRARLAITQDRLADAEHALRELSRLRPPNDTDHLLSADWFRAAGELENAETALAQVRQANQQSAQAWLNLAQDYRRRNLMRRAELALQKALSIDDHLIQARRELIYVYGMQFRRAELAHQFKLLARDLPLNAHDMLVWTLARLDVWINPGVEADLRSFINADPEDHASALALAQALYHAGDIEASRAVLDKLDPDDHAALAIRARLAISESRLDEAESLLNRADPDDPTVTNLRGQIAMLRGDPQGALASFEAALQLGPFNLEAHNGAASALRALRRNEEAARHDRRADSIRALERMLVEARAETAPRDAELAIRLAQACNELECLDEAVGWCMVGLSIDPLNPTLQKLVHHLKAAQRS